MVRTCIRIHSGFPVVVLALFPVPIRSEYHTSLYSTFCFVSVIGHPLMHSMTTQFSTYQFYARQQYCNIRWQQRVNFYSENLAFTLEIHKNKIKMEIYAKLHDFFRSFSPGCNDLPIRSCRWKIKFNELPYGMATHIRTMVHFNGIAIT